VDAGELRTLVTEGILSISLGSDGEGYFAAGGDVAVVGTGSFTRTDGSAGVLADAVFVTGSRVANEQDKANVAAASRFALATAIGASGVALASVAVALEHADSAGSVVNSQLFSGHSVVDEPHQSFVPSDEPSTAFSDDVHADGDRQFMQESVNFANEPTDPVELDHVLEHAEYLPLFDSSGDPEFNSGHAVTSLVDAMLLNMSGMELLDSIISNTENSPAADSINAELIEADVTTALADATDGLYMDALIEGIVGSEGSIDHDAPSVHSDTSALLSMLDHTFSAPETFALYVGSDDTSTQLAQMSS
jgi:hypothetical protein